MDNKKILITGGAGFIGVNLANSLLAKGNRQVIVYDNLSRKGVENNLQWLRSQKYKNLKFIKGDIRDYKKLKDTAKGCIEIYHLAAQVAVTTSVEDPIEDFRINAEGALYVLEAVRKMSPAAAVIFTSTNKVYGELLHLKLREGKTRYILAEKKKGVAETENLDFHSPYGCCYSEDTDILTFDGWKKIRALTDEDEVLTYNIERGIAEYQKPTNYFGYKYKGKMYEQNNRRLKTCVTPNHKMLVSWDCNHNALEKPRLLEAKSIAGKPMAYLLASKLHGGRANSKFILPAVKTGKNKHYFPPRAISMNDWLPFLGWYLAEGHCYENKKTGNCTVTLTTYYRTKEAISVMRAIGLSPVIDHHHITATSKQLYEYLKNFGKSHKKHIPKDIKKLNADYLKLLLKALLDGDGNLQSKNSWKYTSVSRQLAEDVQEVAIKCGMATSCRLDKEGFYRVYISTTRTVQCNLGKNRSKWVDYDGQVYCVEVPNSTVMVRQNGYAYFSGNSKGTADQYFRDYYRIYGMKTVVFRQSCIYGEHQYGNEDQGWVAHFIIKSILGRKINIYGDGKQIRDLLEVSDLIRAYGAALKKIEKAKGEIYNIGGGVENAFSLLELIDFLKKEMKKEIEYDFSEWRPGDQKVFISDNTKLKKELGWSPAISKERGIRKLIGWIEDNIDIIRKANKG